MLYKLVGIMYSLFCLKSQDIAYAQPTFEHRPADNFSKNNPPQEHGFKDG
jgi:hypothetical protein